MVVLVLALTAGIAGLAAAKDRATRTTWAPIVSGLDAPVAIAAAPGEPGNLYVVEKPGRIVVVRGGKVVRTFVDLSPMVGSDGSEQGLCPSPSVPATRRTTSSTSTTPTRTATRGSTSTDRAAASAS